MKASVRRALLLSLALLLLLSAVLGLSSCGGGDDDTTTDGSTTAAIENLADYTLVYSESVSTPVYREILALKDDIKNKAGVTIKTDDDFVLLGGSVPTDTLEILVGRTNRKESISQNLGRDDYAIYFENGRLVITGGSDEATILAITRFRNTYFADGKLLYPKAPDAVRGSYPYGSATIGGVSIHQFSIVHDQNSAPFANVLAEKIAEITGALLPVGSERTRETENEILVGRFESGTRKNTDGLLSSKWRIALSGKKLSLVGGDGDGTYAAVMSFLSRLTGSGATLELSSAASGSTASMGLYSLNLPEVFPSMQGEVSSLSFTADTVLDRFLATRSELPQEITVLERVSLDKYPLSKRCEIYVSPNGNDAAPGTKEAPLATLDEAISRVEGKQGGVIFMMGGTYTLTETVTVGSRHAGIAQAPLFIKAYNGEEVTLTSNKTLDTSAGKWNYLDPYGDPALEAVFERLPEEARDYVMYTTLAEQGWTEDDIPAITKESGPPSMYVGGVEYSLARYPNASTDPRELLYFMYVYDSGRCTVRDGSDLYWKWIDRCTAAGWDPMREVGWEIRIPDEKQYDQDQPIEYAHREAGAEITSWVNTGDIWYYGSTFEGWEFGYYNLALYTEGQYWAHNENGERWTPGDGTPLLGTPKARMYAGQNPNGTNAWGTPEGYSLKSVQPNSWGTKVSSNGQAGRNTFYLFNAIEALDAPGEWFYDKETGYIYIYPTEEHGDLTEEAAAISNSDDFDLLALSGTSNVVIDGLTFDGSAATGLLIEGTKNVMVQDCTFRNTKGYNLYMNSATGVAVIYSDFSAAGINMLRINHSSSNLQLTPTNTVVQNCFFHDPMPLHQVALQWEACRVIVSHNYFNNTTTVGDNSTECIFEYNRFEGGSKDVTDGGMIYASGSASRNNHYRYNLFHMFNATHQAVYNDTAAGGNYMYNNVISTLGALSDHCKSWYSSTGWGNVCYGNIQIFRDPLEVKKAESGAGAEGDIPDLATGDKGDYMGESHLFYYYFDDAHGDASNRAYQPVDYAGNPQKTVNADGTLGEQPTLSQSLAGHWWQGFKRGDVDRYLVRANKAKWTDRDPVFMNAMQVAALVTEHYPESGSKPCDYEVKYFYMPWYECGKSYTYENVPAGTVITVPTYQYLVPVGSSTTEVEVVTVPAYTFTAEGTPITLKYEEIAAIEKQMRSCAYSVVKNNIILGGTPLYETVNGKVVMTDTVDRESMLWDQGVTNVGYVPTTLKENNFMSFLYDDIVPGAKDEYDYTISDEGWAIILGEANPDYTIAEDAVEELRFTDEVWMQAGFTFEFDYGEWYDDVYPEK